MTIHDPAAAAMAFENATAVIARGEFKVGFRDALMALALNPAVDSHRRLALSYFRVMSGYRRLPDAVVSALEHCTNDPSFDLQPLAMVVREILPHDPRMKAMMGLSWSVPQVIEDAIQSDELTWFFEHRLLRAALGRAVNISDHVEWVLMKLRRHALLWQDGRGTPSALVSKHPAFASAMARQSHLCAFPWIETPEETAAVLRHVLTPSAALIVAMYRPVEDQHAEQAQALPLDLSELRCTRLARSEAQTTIRELTPVADVTSRAVARQYHSHPYPPWDAPVGIGETSNWNEIVADMRRRPDGYPSLQAVPARILIAGCGTGFGAVVAAQNAPEAEITAIDLSRTSVAYAMEKADRFAPGRIRFGVGDILNVTALGQWFDFIECSGVLHHMANPIDGLATLTQVLRAGGRMKIGLYSKRGRRSVTAAREWIRLLGWRDVPVGLRGARSALRSLDEGHPARPVTHMVDFYSLDALHDLLFNVMEHCFTPVDLKGLLAQTGLEFLGFDLNPMRAATVDLPQGAAALELDAWDAVEELHPDLFAEMFHFWVRKSWD